MIVRFAWQLVEHCVTSSDCELQKQTQQKRKETMIIRHATDEVISTDLRGMRGGRCHALGIRRRLRNGGEEDLCGRVHQIKDLHRRRRSTCHPRERRVVHVWFGFDKKHLRVVRARGIHPHHLSARTHPTDRSQQKEMAPNPSNGAVRCMMLSLDSFITTIATIIHLTADGRGGMNFCNYSGLMSTLL